LVLKCRPAAKSSADELIRLRSIFWIFEVTAQSYSFSRNSEPLFQTDRLSAHRRFYCAVNSSLFKSSMIEMARHESVIFGGEAEKVSLSFQLSPCDKICGLNSPPQLSSTVCAVMF